MADVLMTKPKQDKLVTPVVGRFVVFPSWITWQPIPFSGDESLRILLYVQLTNGKKASKENYSRAGGSPK